MKTKAKIILKSLADLPANGIAFAASVPGRAAEISRDARQRSADIFRDIYLRANTPLRISFPWSRGGLNE